VEAEFVKILFNTFEAKPLPQMNFTSILSSWYLINKRNLPWRTSKDPYQIWLSEIILQQTRVDPGTDYFHKFVENFPTVKDLAQASEEHVLKLWQGLGYYSRARNLHASAKIIHSSKDKFPDSRAKLLELKGVGPYTSAAIASIAFNEPVAAVDGNVNRVISRFFGVTDPVDSPEGKRQILSLASEVLDEENPGDHNQAMMDFGATQCTPKKPLCSTCPMAQECYANIKGQTNILPLKSAKTKVISIHIDFIVFRTNNRIAAHKRTGDAIWKNLYDFPSIESKSGTHPSIESIGQFLENTLNIEPVVKHLNQFKHLLSHRSITADFWEVNLDMNISFHDADTKMYLLDDFEKLPMPRLIDKFWQTYKHSYNQAN
jgi:A/G-specific adenine glycosylase